jgi:hypothetical protein
MPRRIIDIMDVMQDAWMLQNSMRHFKRYLAEIRRMTRRSFFQSLSVSRKWRYLRAYFLQLPHLLGQQTVPVTMGTTPTRVYIRTILGEEFKLEFSPRWSEVLLTGTFFFNENVDVRVDVFWSLRDDANRELVKYSEVHVWNRRNTFLPRILQGIAAVLRASRFPAVTRIRSMDAMNRNLRNPHDRQQ